MNELNYASREASRRLQKAGIVLETEKVWGFRDGIWTLFEREGIELEEVKSWIPAPMFTDVWRELPEWYDRGRKTMVQQEGKTSCGYLRLNNSTSTEAYTSANPPDALIDLRIWIEEQGKEKS